ncbi:MAG: T9SS type A sorting domain-containing protein [Bacteroidales bacterium]|nr:T9SS type A sorting domain-containing protein [Bacteroidales bacterium]
MARTRADRTAAGDCRTQHRPRLGDGQGRTVRTRFIAPASSQTAMVDVRNVPAGVYMLRVTDGEGKEYGRKVVKR